MVSTWNLRDRHRVKTMAALQSFLPKKNCDGITVLAHNSHVGDARPTSRARAIVREH